MAPRRRPVRLDRCGNRSSGVRHRVSSLADRTALVTGGGTGLGAAISRRLHAERVRVVVAGRRSDPLQRLADELGNGIRAEVCHVADPDSVADLARRVRGELVSILINNAGIAGPVAPLTEIDPDAWDEVFATNVRGTFLMCRAFLPAMIERGSGDIINLASVSGKRPLMKELRHGVRGQTYVCSNPKLLCCVRQAEPSTVAMLSGPCRSPGGGHKEALDGHQPRGGSARRSFPTDGVPGLARQHQGVGADEATGTRSCGSPWLRDECHRPRLVHGSIGPARPAAHRSGEPVLPARHGSDGPRAGRGGLSTRPDDRILRGRSYR